MKSRQTILVLLLIMILILSIHHMKLNDLQNNSIKNKNANAGNIVEAKEDEINVINENMETKIESDIQKQQSMIGLDQIYDIPQNKFHYEVEYEGIGLGYDYPSDTLNVVGESIYDLEPLNDLVAVVVNTDVQIYDETTWQLISELNVHNGSILAIDVSSSGAYMAIASADTNITIWDTTTWDMVALLANHQNKVTDVQFMSDESKLISVSYDTYVRIWDTSTWNEIESHQVKATTWDPPGQLLSSALSPDQNYLAVTVLDADNAVVINMTNWNDNYTLYHERQMKGLAFSPDGKYLITTSSFDQDAMIWNTSDWTQILYLRNHYNEIIDISFSHNSQLFASIGYDGTMRILNTSTWQEMLKIRVGSSQIRSPIIFSNDDTQIISIDANSVMKQWNISIFEPKMFHTANINAMALSPDGNLLVSGGDDHAIILWNITNGNPNAIWTSYHHTGDINKLEFTKNGRQIISVGDDGVLLWNVTTGQVEDSIMSGGPGDKIKSVDYNQNELVAIGVEAFSFGNYAVITNITSKQQIFGKMHPHDSYGIDSVAVSPTASILATGGVHGIMKIWNITDGTLLFQYNLNGQVTFLKFSPDGQFLVSRAYGRITIWNTTSWQTYQGAGSYTKDIKFTSDGSRLIYSDANSMLTLWDYIITPEVYKSPESYRYTDLDLQTTAIGISDDSQKVALSTLTGGLYILRAIPFYEDHRQIDIVDNTFQIAVNNLPLVNFNYTVSIDGAVYNNMKDIYSMNNYLDIQISTIQLGYHLIEIIMSQNNQTIGLVKFTYYGYESILPTISSIGETQVIYGSQYDLIWNVYDVNPDWFQLLLKNEYGHDAYFDSGQWISGDFIVSNPVQDVGTYNFTLEILDSSGNVARNSIVLHIIREETEPSLISASSSPIEKDNPPANVIEWTVGDQYPDLYSIYYDNSLLESNIPWTNMTIKIPYEDTMQIGTHNFTIVVSDTSGNVAISTIMIQIQDTVSPTISNITDKTIEIGSVINDISFTVTDSALNSVTLLLNDQLIENQFTTTGNGEYILSLIPSDLIIGENIVKINATDLYGNSKVQSFTMTLEDTTSPDIDYDKTMEYNDLTKNTIPEDTKQLVIVVKDFSEIASLSYQWGQGEQKNAALMKMVASDSPFAYNYYYYTIDVPQDLSEDITLEIKINDSYDNLRTLTYQYSFAVQQGTETSDTIPSSQNLPSNQNDDHSNKLSFMEPVAALITIFTIYTVFNVNRKNKK